MQEIIEDMETNDYDSDGENIDESSFFKRLCMILKNYTFMLLCVSITGLYYILAGIQYWVSLYMIEVLKVEKSLVFTTFGIISITGPVGGVIVGGIVITKLGGCEVPKALYISLAIAFACGMVAAPIPFVTGKDNYFLFCALLWLLLFAGGFMLGPMTGIMLAIVDDSLKTTANSVANLIYNLGGYMPGPYLYGIVYAYG